MELKERGFIMLVNRVNLFNNRFKNYKNANVNKNYTTFSAKKPKLPDEAGKAVKEGVKNVIEITIEDIKRVFPEYVPSYDEEVRRIPGMPESD